MNYSGIVECDVLNGEFFRTVIFLSGCDNFCPHCHNKETWDENFGHPFTDKTLEKLMEFVSKDYIDGITITGGDSLYKNNLDGVINIITEIKKRFPNKTIWIYSGSNFDDIFDPKNDEDLLILKRREIIKLCTVLVDGKYEHDKRNLMCKWRGSENQRVIDVQKSLDAGEVILYCD